MIQTIKFRLYPSASGEAKLQEVFTIYNRVRRAGYNLFLELKDADYTQKEKWNIIQPKLMELCHNFIKKFIHRI